MIRKLLWSSITGLAMLLPVAFTATAEAGPGWGGHRHHHSYRPVFEHRHHCHYKVLFRDCHCQTWQCYGTFHSECQAYDVARSLRCSGYETRVIPV